MGKFRLPLQGSRTSRQKGEIVSIRLDTSTSGDLLAFILTQLLSSIRVIFKCQRLNEGQEDLFLSLCSRKSNFERLGSICGLFDFKRHVCIYINTRRKRKERESEWTEKHLFSRWSRQRIISLNLFDDIPQFQWFANLQRRHAKHLFTFEFVQLIAVDLMFGENDRRILVALLMEKCNQTVGCPIVNIRNITT